MLASSNIFLESPTLPGRDYQAAALGTWGGATVTLLTYADGAWRAVPDGVYTADFEIVRTNGPGSAARLAVTNSTGATSLALAITELPQ